MEKKSTEVKARVVKAEVTFHGFNQEQFDALAKVFPAESSGATKWISLKGTGIVDFTVFRADTNDEKENT